MDRVQTSQNQTETPTTRRTFYVAAIYGIGGLITAALGLPALLYLLVPARMRRQSEWVDVGDIAQLPAGIPSEMAYRRIRVDGWKVSSEKSTTWVVKKNNNQVVAFGPECTHLGCPYHWDEGKTEFVCPCHNSIFSPEGKVLGGPAPRPLDRYETRLEGTKLSIGRLKTSPEQAS